MLIFETVENANITQLGMDATTLIENIKKNVGLIEIFDNPGSHLISIPIDVYDTHALLELKLMRDNLHCDGVTFLLHKIKYRIKDNVDDEQLGYLIRFIQGIALVLINRQNHETDSNQKEIDNGDNC